MMRATGWSAASGIRAKECDGSDGGFDSPALHAKEVTWLERKVAVMSLSDAWAEEHEFERRLKALKEEGSSAAETLMTLGASK